MAVDRRRLEGYFVESVAQSYTAKDSALYALSIGLGQDPMDPRQLAFVDPNKGDGQLVVPSMALVIGYPGFWLVRPDTTIDPSRILHGSQKVDWHRQLPANGDVVGRTRVLRVVDRGAGRHAMVVSERQIIDAHSELPYATLTQVHVLLGQGGFGGDAGPLAPPHSLPDSPPDLRKICPTRPEQALIYRLNGDLFPLHADPVAAQAAGFDRPILHGMCVAGIVTNALMAALADGDPSRMREIEMRFSSPVFPGETLRIDIWRDGSFRASCVERDVVVLDNGHLDVSD